MGTQKTLRIKFCGGCNPEYDRVALAEQVQAMARTNGVTVITDGQPNVLVVICGCACACADWTAFDSSAIVMLTDDNPEGFEMDRLRRLLSAGDMAG
ncbi:MAG: hypothetical protein SWH61_12845 [Thermodesulfobacteriota bacterium]|nr:hypothetical protein [Thermodesulfobacteriota bacterium]